MRLWNHRGMTLLTQNEANVYYFYRDVYYKVNLDSYT